MLITSTCRSLQYQNFFDSAEFNNSVTFYSYSYKILSSSSNINVFIPSENLISPVKVIKSNNFYLYRQDIVVKYETVNGKIEHTFNNAVLFKLDSHPTEICYGKFDLKRTFVLIPHFNDTIILDTCLILHPEENSSINTFQIIHARLIISDAELADSASIYIGERINYRVGGEELNDCFCHDLFKALNNSFDYYKLLLGIAFMIPLILLCYSFIRNILEH